ncbi:MAG: hypothetical protein KAT46_06415 [Deltaproteobacteria bacterium]|nr:hypothetical protein [Deltaproteobacteria bacterium]
MTFVEFIKRKKKLEPAEHDLDELMEKYYEEYQELLSKIKDGCGTD